LSKPIADKIGRKPANIYIDYNHLRHIEIRRGDYLKSVNHDPLSYVQTIVNNYTEIRERQDNSLLLVAYIPENKHNNMAVIELTLIANKSHYIVKAAMPRRIENVKNEVILWAK